MTLTATHPKTARSVMFVGPRNVDVRDVDLPAVGSRDVRLGALYSGPSAGTEMNVYRGSAAQWRAKRNPHTLLFEPTEEPEWSYPLAYGYAAVGRVEEVGSDVTEVRTGQLVFSYSQHASAAVVSVDSVMPLPEMPDPRVGVFTANLRTAYNGTLDAHPHLGDVVVISGLGVVGLILVQLMRASGARVIGIDTVPQRRQLGERFGAELTLAPGPKTAEHIRTLTANRGADIVVEASGAAPALNDAIRIAGYGGTVIAMSWYGGTFESLNLSGEFHHNRIRVISSQVTGLPPGLGPLWSKERRSDVVASLLPKLDLAPMLTHEFDVEDAAEAYRTIDTRPDDLVQLVLTYSGKV